MKTWTVMAPVSSLFWRVKNLLMIHVQGEYHVQQIPGKKISFYHQQNQSHEILPTGMISISESTSIWSQNVCQKKMPNIKNAWNFIASLGQTLINPWRSGNKRWSELQEQRSRNLKMLSVLRSDWFPINLTANGHLNPTGRRIICTNLN